uniref:SURF6 domain-containing protein n=1 Tax=Gongylonema pulchrum TaxID=637853 RepID=A0A183D894_9BILA
LQDDSIVRRRKQTDLEKQKYEEDYLIRLQVSKKERHKKRLENRQNILDELLHFGNYMAVQNAENDGERRAGKKRTKMGRKGKLSKKPRLATKNKKEKVGRF